MENLRKKVLTLKEASIYTGYAVSYLYKLIESGSIPYSKPNGKYIFFDIDKLDRWLLSNAVDGREERSVKFDRFQFKHKL